MLRGQLTPAPLPLFPHLQRSTSKCVLRPLPKIMILGDGRKRGEEKRKRREKKLASFVTYSKLFTTTHWEERDKGLEEKKSGRCREKGDFKT